jgi:hypothetical protein
MLFLITYRRLTQGILLLHRYLLLYHPSVLPSLHEFLFNVQNRKYTQDLLHFTVHKVSFPMSLYLPNRTPDKRVTPVLLRWWNLSWNFRTRNAQCFLHNSLHRPSNSLVLDALEWQLDGASEYLIFLICTPLNKFSNWWRQQHPLRDSERLMIYLATL